eukprot:7388330-Prymnesium_polylepis.1
MVSAHGIPAAIVCCKDLNLGCRIQRLLNPMAVVRIPVRQVVADRGADADVLCDVPRPAGSTTAVHPGEHPGQAARLSSRDVSRHNAGAAEAVEEMKLKFNKISWSDVPPASLRAEKRRRLTAGLGLNLT